MPVGVNKCQQGETSVSRGKQVSFVPNMLTILPKESKHTKDAQNFSIPNFEVYYEV